MCVKTELSSLLLVMFLAGATRAEDTAELSLDEPTTGAKADESSATTPPADAFDTPTPSGNGEAPEQLPASGKTATDEGIDLTMQDRIKAVARKTFLKAGRLEIAPLAQVSVNDAFIRTIAGGGRISLHLNDAFSIEVGGAYVPPTFAQRLEPAEVLKEKLALINVDNTLVGMADVGITFSPLYGKLAVFGDQIVHFDGFVSGGVGAAFDSGVDLVHPAMSVGFGIRAFLSRWLVFRVELRDLIYPQEKSQISTVQNLVFFGAGVGFYLPPDFEYQNEAARVNPNG
jgi:outer membrane beta-barrel protein